ncbi:hypothetical protein [Desertibaculum subflavum]|uniref:hypothetical protein n=1 Tax=Desertibaculum subflavum TaxID=2268458 RepID=UPI0013C42076
MRWGIVLGFLCALFACAPSIAPTRWEALPEGQRAVMFGTITADISAGAINRYMLRYRNFDTGETAALNVEPLDDSGDDDLRERGRVVGRFFEVTLPPGRYEFYDVSFLAMGLFGASREWSARTPFSLPFTIQAGRTHYLGDVRAYPARAGGYFTFTDREARARELLAKRRAAAKAPPPPADIVNIVPDPDKAGTPFLRRGG